MSGAVAIEDAGRAPTGTLADDAARAAVGVLLSGGMDSAIALYWAIAGYGREHVFALSIDYGQRHRRELSSARRIAHAAGVEHVGRAIVVPWGESLLTGGALRVRPVKRDVARAFVATHHSHHRAHVADRISLGAFVERELVGVVVLGSPHAPPLDDGETWEVTRLCCGPRAPRYAASRLLGRATRVGLSAGLSLLVSYTRIDEPGSCYAAANWRPVAITSGRPHDTGNRALRWLPGLEDAVRTTDVIDRVRWEIGPRAGEPGALWNGERWVRREREAA